MKDMAGTPIQEVEAWLGTYDFLAGAFARPPSDGVIDLIRRGRMLEEMDVPAGSNARGELERFMKEEAGGPDLVRRLTADFTRLFMLPNGLGQNLRPFESIFLDQNLRMGGKITVGVRRFYEYAGASFKPSLDVLEDHISVELEFMAFLLRVEMDALATGQGTIVPDVRRVQNDFLQDHLLRWVFPLACAVRQKAQSGYYRALGCILEDFAEAEQERSGGATQSLEKERTE